jgi:hypothetical protein
MVMDRTIARQAPQHAKVDMGRPPRAVSVSQDLLIDLRAACDELRATNAAIVESTVLNQRAVVALGRVLVAIRDDANRRQGRAA